MTHDRIVIKPRSSDRMVLYSDGVSETTSPDGKELGRDGLMNIARALDSNSAEALGSQLTSALCAFRGDGQLLDDETIIVMTKNNV